MKRSLCQLAAALVLAACLLLQSVHCASAGPSPGSRQRHSPSLSLDEYLALRALLLPERRLPSYHLYDDMFDDMERSRRSGPAIEGFEPVSISSLRRLIQGRLDAANKMEVQNRIDKNTDYFREIGRR